MLCLWDPDQIRLEKCGEIAPLAERGAYPLLVESSGVGRVSYALTLLPDFGKDFKFVNGKLANEGSEAFPSNGKILFQSEGAVR